MFHSRAALLDRMTMEPSMRRSVRTTRSIRRGMMRRATTMRTAIKMRMAIKMRIATNMRMAGSAKEINTCYIWSTAKAFPMASTVTHEHGTRMPMAVVGTVIER
jgi:hypothetical protein